MAQAFSCASQSRAACGVCKEVCKSAPNLLALAVRVPPRLLTKGPTCVLFAADLTYAAYKNLHNFDQIHLGLFECLHLASVMLRKA